MNDITENFLKPLVVILAMGGAVAVVLGWDAPPKLAAYVAFIAFAQSVKFKK